MKVICMKDIWNNGITTQDFLCPCGCQFFIINDPVYEEGYQYINIEKRDACWDTNEKTGRYAMTNNNFKKGRFLFECDEVGTIREQAIRAKEVEDIAWSCVYSGGKSIHIILNTNLDECLKNFTSISEKEKCHQFIWDELHEIYFPGVNMDSQCKNSTRKSRKPNEMRDNGIKQKLCYFHPEHIIDVSDLVWKYLEHSAKEKARGQMLSELHNSNGESFAQRHNNDLKAVLEIDEEKSINPEALMAAKRCIRFEGGWNDSAKACGYLQRLGYPDYIIKNEIDWGDWDIRKYLK